MTAQRPNEPSVVGWDDERLPKVWQPEVGMAKNDALGCAICLMLTVVVCAGFLTLFGGTFSLNGLMIATVGAGIFGILLGAGWAWREESSQKAEHELLKRELSEQQIHDLLSLTKRVFKDEGWILVEPVRVVWGTDTWTILTNPQGRGCEGRVVVKKNTLEIVEKAFLPR